MDRFIANFKKKIQVEIFHSQRLLLGIMISASNLVLVVGEEDADFAIFCSRIVYI